MFYALVCLIATVGIADWFDWAYWGIAFLAVLGCVEMYIAESDDELDAAASLNWLSWIIAAVVLALIVKAAGGQLTQETSQGLSGYAVNVKLPTVAGMAMVRSTGISRFAGAIGLVAFGLIWGGERFIRLLGVALFAGCGWLIWVMQGRGSTASFVGGIGVMLWLMGGRARRIGIGVSVLVIAAVSFQFISHATIDHVWRFVTRNDHHLENMHGRLGIYDEVWRAFWQSPLIGSGPQADHRVAFTNAQNGVLYALLCGGVIGGGAWILGFAISLGYLVRAALRPDIVPRSDATIFAQVAGLMVFFTLRTIPENTAALFSVDLMLQLPAMVYLGALIRAAKRQDLGDYAETLVTVPGAPRYAFEARESRSALRYDALRVERGD